MKKVLLFLTLSLYPLFGYSQATPDDIIKKFFTDYASNTDKAVDDIYATNAWTNRVTEPIENLKKEIRGFTVDYIGKYYGYELISKTSCTENFILYSYFVRYDRQPMKFVFEFYKPNNQWSLYAFNLSATIDDDVEEAAKYYYLDPSKK